MGGMGTEKRRKEGRLKKNEGGGEREGERKRQRGKERERERWKREV